MTNHKPRIGLMGIMQDLYDEMLPGITERQSNYARAVAEQLSDVAEVIFPKAVRNRADAEEVVAQFERDGLDGIMMVMLTYGPAMNVTRALVNTRLPLMLANIQPERTITPAWDMGDMTYNQGVHGAQDQANALVRAGVPLPIITDDWRSESFKRQFEDWARAAATVTGLRKLKVAIFGYAMNGMGDIRVDETAMLRRLGPEIRFLATGDLYRAMQAASDDDVAQVIEQENAWFEIDPKLSQAQREESARYQVALKKILDEGGYGAYSTHFDAIAEDGRFSFLPVAAASNLMAEGYGFGAEGDACSAILVAAGHLLAGDAHFTEMYAMDFDRDTALLSHMGEGNWKVARDDEPIKLIDRPLGIGGLDNPPTVLFRVKPGPATLTSLVPLGGEHFRLVLSEGEIIPDSPVMPSLEMPYGEYRPSTGVRQALNGWLRAGGTHHKCLSRGHIANRWRLFAELAGIEVAEV
ncbi:MAG: arabinose isomerase [Chloroflexi bacterium]|nr:arabinose isomerase [Chloroflexota bacterium]